VTGAYGQDWASYQPATPATTGLAFVFVKATEGTGYANPLHAAQVSHVRADGLVVGHYHYPHMAADAPAEADRFLAVAKPQPGDVLILDWEGYDPANKGVPFSRQVAYKAAFLARLAAVAPLHQHLTYCNTDYLGRDPDGPYGDALWIATSGRPAGQPGISHNWLIHQYSTAGGIDHDYCPLSPAQLNAWSHAKENTVPDLTPQIADDTKTLRGDLTKVTSLTEKDAAGHPAVHPASYYLAHTHYDAVLLNTKIDGLTSQVAALAKNQGAPTLTDAQVSAIAAQVAASPVLAAAVAEQVAVKIAARLAQ
jgi:hypothetical protein